jgi:hypothetical protein
MRERHWVVQRQEVGASELNKFGKKGIRERPTWSLFKWVFKTWNATFFVVWGKWFLGKERANEKNIGILEEAKS